jgi:hypothetical protein
MKIIWNEQFKQFEAQLTAGEHWSNDQQAAKKAGFRTEGPPNWVWLTQRVKPLIALKKSKPLSGLTITSEALENYNRLLAQEEANAAVKKQLKEAKKAQKEKQIEESGSTSFQYDKDGWAVIDPGESTIWSEKTKFIPPPLPTELCSVCRTPIYFYEQHEPIALCLDCECPKEF